jgi:glucose/arabinose dehydrogenase
MRYALLWIIGPLAALLAGCTMAPLEVTSQPRDVVLDKPPAMPPIPAPSASALALPEGYRADVMVKDLTYPTTGTFDDRENFYVAESGYVYGDASAPARIWRIARDGKMSILASEGLSGPITDLMWHRGQLYVSHRGKVSVVDGGKVRDLVTGLPSHGDHFNNQLAAGPDGKLYMGQGTATNSGVVGVDNWAMGWLQRYPNFHDTPAQSIVLKGTDYLTLNPMVMTVGKQPPMATTGGFQPFGENGKEKIRGEAKANGTILRFNPDGSGLEVYAWGLRNPYGLVWTRDGRLFTAENGFDDRGTRPVDNAPDSLWEIRQGAWYGWPDFASGIPVTDKRLQPKDKPKLEMLMAKHPAPVGTPFLTRPPHSALTQLVQSPGGAFGFDGQLFLAEFGDMAPLVGHVKAPTGYGVYRIDLSTKQVVPFARTSPSALGPKGLEYAATAGLKRPVDVFFSPSGSTLYIVDLGVFPVPPTAAPMPMPKEATGVVWRVYRSGTSPEGPPAGLSPLPRS